jgi:hypothetical protein
MKTKTNVKAGRRSVSFKIHERVRPENQDQCEGRRPRRRKIATQLAAHEHASLRNRRKKSSKKENRRKEGALRTRTNVKAGAIDGYIWF